MWLRLRDVVLSSSYVRTYPYFRGGGGNNAGPATDTAPDFTFFRTGREFFFNRTYVQLYVHTYVTPCALKNGLKNNKVVNCDGSGKSYFFSPDSGAEVHFKKVQKVGVVA